MAATVPPDLPPGPAGAPPSEPPPPPGAGAAPLPWEQPGYPPLEGLFETAKLFVLRPSEAYARMSTAGDLGKPLLYAIVLGWVGVIASQIYQMLMPGMPWRYFPGMRHAMDFTVPFAYTIGTMVLAPVFVLLALFIWAAIVHLILMIAGGANSSFTTTLRVLCYATTTQVVSVVPFCGGLIGGLWAIVLEIIGLAQAHRTTQGKAALAVLLPIALCCACVAVVLALGVGTLIAMVSSSR